MQNTKLILILACVLGAVLGFMAFAIKIVMDNEGLVINLYEFLRGYLFAGGQHLSVVYKLLIGLVGGMAALGTLAIVLVTRRNKQKLDEIYAGFDMDSRYLVQQRGRETFLFAILLFVVAAGLLYLFNSVHKLEGNSSFMASARLYSSIRFPFIALFTTLILCLMSVSGALVALYGSLNYGRYKNIPIGLTSDTISFFKCFVSLPVIAIDQAVSVNLNHADIDFKTEGGKGLLYVFNSNTRVVVSPKLEFINGSFDELADYVEQFAVEEEE